MKPSETQQLKLNQLEAEMMTVEMNKAALEAKIIVTRDSIIHERKCEQKELSAAEKWSEKITPSKEFHGTFGVDHPAKVIKLYSFTQLMASHEAGQKHGAGVERERHSKIVELCRYMVRHFDIIFAQAASSMTYQKLTAALKNLESDTEPEHGGVDAQLIDITHSSGQGTRVTTCRVITDGWHDFSPRQKFKLTPIKSGDDK